MSSRNQSIDVLRGIAVLGAVASHYPNIVHIDSAILAAGKCGVDLFFVISGYLISGLLFSEFKQTGKIHPLRFWIRRGFKIYPAFYFFLAATAVMFLIAIRRLPIELGVEALFVQNYLPHVWQHTWSLAVEEHFYFALPLLFVLLIAINHRNPFRPVPILSIAISGLCFYLRVLALKHSATWDHVGFPTHLRMDALFSGVALGYYAHFDEKSFQEARKLWVLIIGIIFSLTLIALPDFTRISFAYVVFVFIVAWAGNQEKPVPLWLKPLAWIGVYSYSIYIWQVFIMMALPHFPASWYRLPLFLICCVASGVITSVLIEVPMLRVRDKFFPSLFHHAASDDSISHPTHLVTVGGQYADQGVIP